MGFLKIQAKKFPLPFPQLSQLVKGEKKLNYSKHFYVFDIVVKVRPLSKIERKAKAKRSFVFRHYEKLIHADKGGRNRLFVPMMPHKRQGVWDLFNYSLDFMGRNIQNYNQLSLL